MIDSYPQSIQIGLGKITYLEPQLLILEIQNNKDFQKLETIKPLVEELIEHFYGNSVWILNDFRQYNATLPKAIRGHILKTLGSYLEASAFVVGSGLSRIVGNIIINFSKTKHPRKLFSDVKPALAWLKQLKQNKY